MLKAVQRQIIWMLFIPILLVGCVADKGASKSATCGSGEAFDPVTRKCFNVSQGATVPTQVPPVGTTTTATISEDTLGSPVSLSYTDVDGHIATACSVSNLSANLTLVTACTCSGGFCFASFAPDPDNAIPGNFDYTVTDTNGISDPVTVALTITNINDAPSFATTVLNPVAGNEDTVQVLSLTSASDIDCDPTLNVLPNGNCPSALSYSVVSYSRPSDPWAVGSEPTFGGNLLQNCMGFNGSSIDDVVCDFHPEANFFGTYQFVYRANDGWTNSSNDVTVNITVTSVNDAPTVACTAPCTLTVPEDGANAVPQTPGTAAPLAFEVTNSGAVAGVTGITHTFSDIEDTGGLNDITAYTSCAVNGAGLTIGNIVVNSTGVGSCVLEWDATGFEDQNGAAGTFLLTFNDADGGSNSITVNLSVAAKNDNPSAANTFIRYNGLAHQGDPFLESDTAFATDAPNYPYLFTIDAATSVDPTIATPSETLTFTLDTVSWVLNGVAGGPVVPGDVSVPFTVTNCMGGTTNRDCSLGFKGNDGNVHGTISLNFTVSDGNGGSDSDTVTVAITPVMDAPVACQYSRFTDAPECTLAGCSNNSSPLGVLAPVSHTASKPVVWYDSSRATCWISTGVTNTSWSPTGSGLLAQAINEKDVLYIRRLIIDEGGTDVVEDGLDLQISNLQSSNSILIRPENVLFSYDGTAGNEGRADLVPYDWQAVTADSGDDYTGYIKITPTGTTAGSSTITFDVVTSPAGATTSVSFVVTVNPVSIQHNDWKVITAAGPTINKYGEIKNVSNVCSYSRDQCNGGVCTGTAAPTTASVGGALNAIYWASASSQCYYHDGTDWAPFTTVCPVTASAFESNCTGASCLGNAAPANADGLGHFFYDMDDDQCYVSTGAATWTAFDAPASATIGWENFTISGTGSISGYWIYRRVAGEEFDYDFPINKTIVSLGATNYIDNATNSWEPPAPNFAYYYEVRPVVNSIPTKPVESYAEARLIAPNNNMTFMSRRIANKLMCAKLFSPSDKTNENRCPYVGPGDIAPGYYDVGEDLIVDRFEAGCAYTQGTCTTTDGNCVGDGIPGVSGFNPNNIDTTIYYSRANGRCYRRTAGVWEDFETRNTPGDFVADYFNTELPPLVYVNQAQATSFCTAAGAQPAVIGLSAAPTRALPTRKQQMAYSQWDTQSLNDTTISSLETGLSLNTTAKCNSSSASGLTGYSDTETPDSSSAYSLPGTNSSGIRSVATGATQTSACQSFAGVQDAVGNVAEWIQEQFDCTAGVAECEGIGASFSTAVAGSFISNGTGKRYGVFQGVDVAGTYYFGSTGDATDSPVPIGPCNNIDALDDCELPLNSWTFESRDMEAGRFFIPMGLPVNRDYNDNLTDPINLPVYPTGHPQAGQSVGTITSWAKVIGQSSGITNNQLHGDSLNFNMTNVIGTTAGMVTGGGYTDGSGGGLYRFELQPNTQTAVNIGFRCVAPVSGTFDP